MAVPPPLGEEWSAARPSAVLRQMERVFVWGDVVWTVDAFFFLAAWARDSVGLAFIEEGEDEDEDAAMEAQESEPEGAGSGGALFSFAFGGGGGGSGKAARAGGDVSAGALREALLDSEAPGGAGARPGPGSTPRSLQ